MNAPSEISFLPDDYLESKRQRRTNGMCAGLFLIVVVAIGLAFTLMEQAMKGVNRELAEVSARYAEAARPIAQFKQMQDKERTMQAQAALTASLLEKAPRSYILARITNALPAGVSLVDFSLDAKQHNAVNPGSGAPTAAPRNRYEIKKAELEAQRTAAIAASPETKAYDVSIKLTGIADSDVQVAAYIKQLSDCSLFQDVNLVVSDEFEQAKQKVRRFQIEFMLNPEAQVRPEPKARGPVETLADESAAPVAEPQRPHSDVTHHPGIATAPASFERPVAPETSAR